MKECDHVFIIKAKMISRTVGFEGRVIAYCPLRKTEWSTAWVSMSNIRRKVGKDATVATRE